MKQLPNNLTCSGNFLHGMQWNIGLVSRWVWKGKRSLILRTEFWAIIVWQQVCDQRNCKIQWLVSLFVFVGTAGHLQKVLLLSLVGKTLVQVNIWNVRKKNMTEGGASTRLWLLVATAWHSYLSKYLFADSKRQIKHSCDVIFCQPRHALVKQRVHCLHVTEIARTERGT